MLNVFFDSLVDFYENVSVYLLFIRLRLGGSVQKIVVPRANRPVIQQIYNGADLNE